MRDKAIANGTFNRDEFIDEATVSTNSRERSELGGANFCETSEPSKVQMREEWVE